MGETSRVCAFNPARFLGGLLPQHKPVHRLRHAGDGCINLLKRDASTAWSNYACKSISAITRSLMKKSGAKK